MDLIACKPICIDGLCQNCPTIDLECIKDCDSIMFYKWDKGSKYYQKSLFMLSDIEVSDLLEEQITYLRTHYYRKCVQSKEYTRQVHELSEGEMVVHVDYSKNYKNKQENKIKAAYYGQGTFSLYTVVLYIKDSRVVKSRSFALVTEENDYSFNISYGLSKFILTLIRNEVNINHFKFWSDGCASQFRRQYAFYMMTKLDQDIKIHWNYFEASYDKGAVDGLGLTVKHAVFCHVQSGCVMINSPQQFAEYVGKLLENVSVIYIPTESLELQYHDECRQKSVYVHGTLKVHYVDWFISTDFVVMKFYQTTISKQLVQEVKYCMQGQDDNVSSLEDDHAPRSNPEKEFQVGNYCLVNY